MGVLTDFFIATEEEMDTVCHGWKKPAPLLDEYRSLSATNPFTKEPMTIRTRANPDQPAADEDAVLACEFRHLPWIAKKGILTTEVAQLACVLLDWEDEDAEQEIHGRFLNGPKGTEELVIHVPPTLVDRLGRLSPDECTRYGAEWAKWRREKTVNVLGELMNDSEPVHLDSQWVSLLLELAGLAKRAVADGRGMYMWMCP